jgi:Zn-dependent alcohol dehydrogenase
MRPNRLVNQQGIAMKTRAAILRSAPRSWAAVDVDLDEARQNELLVKMVASGLCHADANVATGDLTVPTSPIVVVPGPQLKLEELVTRTYSLDEINHGYSDMHADLNLRGLIVHTHA